MRLIPLEMAYIPLRYALEGPPEDIPKGAPKDTPKGAPEDTPKGAPEDTP